jgi:hypothetical protein
LLGIDGRSDIVESPSDFDEGAALPAVSFTGGTLGRTTRRAFESVNHRAPNGMTEGKVGRTQGVLAQFTQGWAVAYGRRFYAVLSGHPKYPLG